jgi:hypothetical protein
LVYKNSCIKRIRTFIVRGLQPSGATYDTFVWLPSNKNTVHLGSGGSSGLPVYVLSEELEEDKQLRSKLHLETLVTDLLTFDY